MTSSSRPIRASPARARSTASYSPEWTFADPGVDVATNADHVQTEAEGEQLRDPPRRARADPAAGRKLAQGEPVAGHDHVARVLARGHGGERDPVGGGGREVLERVHRDVDLAASRASRSALTKTPVPPACSSGVPAAWVRSPSVVISTSSVSRPSRSRISAATSSDWVVARREARVPIRIGASRHDRSPSGRVTASTASGSSANSSARAAA